MYQSLHSSQYHRTSQVRWLLLGLSILLLVACNRAEAQDGAAPVTMTATPAPVVIVVPTVTPTEASSQESPAEVVQPTILPEATSPLDASDVTTATVPAQTNTGIQASTAITPPTPPVAPPTVERVALVRYRDNQYARAGDFTILSTNLPLAPASHHYDLWLVKNGQPTFRLGRLPAQTPLNFTDSADQNLLTSYEGALLSLEPDVNTPGEMGPIVFQGSLPAEALVHIRQIASRFVGNPDDQGFLIGAQTQWQLARQHADLLQQALAANNLSEGHRHAEHVINIINGKNGKNGTPYGDLDGNGVAQNPGDGVGVVGYLLGTQAEAKLATETTDATAEIKLHAGHVLISSDNVIGWLAEASDEGLRVLSADSAEEAQPTAADLARMLEQAYAGIDPDGDGVVMPIAGQGGLLTAYEHTLNMGGIEIYPVNGERLPAQSVPSAAAQAVLPTPTLATAKTEAQAHEHETAETQPTAPLAPTAEPSLLPTPTSAPIQIVMEDFAFNTPTLTIPVGTTVTWLNRDNAKHSATADDGSFDTGLLNSGGSASVTFTQPGAYAYYCVLHGGSGGVGMAGTIVVQ